jgi:hypothetical protein
MNEFAKDITLQEGLKKSVNIAQVKEILKLILIKLADMDDNEVQKLLGRYRSV